MSKVREPAIQLAGVGKMYKVFRSPFHGLLDTLGVPRLPGLGPDRYREFWALRHVDLDVPSGERLGIVGANGGGKSTLLKLITGNSAVTEGKLAVHGTVQALMSTGAGFHPEFSGRENIVASLTYQGLSPDEIRAAIDEISEFTELPDFLDQPFKTYSAGMQARLTFATATTVRPDILIVDEVLGAGDGYFVQKSAERMTRLVESAGATVLIVSHALDLTVRFCRQAIWIDRGRIVQRGSALEVVKAYEQFLRQRSERRLKAKNLAHRARSRDTGRIGDYNDSVVLRFVVQGRAGARCDVSDVVLREKGEILESLRLGDAQDTDANRAAFVLVDERSRWKEPAGSKDRPYRSVAVDSGGESGGSVIFYVYAFDPGSPYTVDVTCRQQDAEQVVLEIWRGGSVTCRLPLESTGSAWDTSSTEIDVGTGEGPAPAAPGVGVPAPRAVRRWPSEGSLTIAEVTVRNEDDGERSVFSPGDTMIVQVTIEAQRDGSYPLRPAVSIFRLDGILVCHLICDEQLALDARRGDRRVTCLEIGPLSLGAGVYVFSVALFGERIDSGNRYDLIDRAYEFEVVTDDQSLKDSIFRLPGRWQLVPEPDLSERQPRSAHPA